ncbi:MAG: hypothetical protein AB1801_04825 [Chloroflexota bacterium]
MDNFLSTVAAIRELLNSRERDEHKLGVLARSLRWRNAFEAANLAMLLDLGELARRKKGPGYWEVERAVMEILCERAEVEHVAFLVQTFHHKARGPHGDDRRRLALQALSGVAARTGNQEALLVLAEGLAHIKKDTRGWTIGFLVECYRYLDRPLPETVVERLRFLAQNDVSADVRVEAVTVLASLGLAEETALAAVMAMAQQQMVDSRR